MKDLYNKLGVVSILDPIAISATAIKEDIDLAGFNSACLLINCGLDDGTGLAADHKFVFTLQHSYDGDNYANVETKDVLGVEVTSGVVLTIADTDSDNTLYKIGYVGGRRYLKLVYTVTGTVSMPMSIELVKGNPESSPV